MPVCVIREELRVRPRDRFRATTWWEFGLRLLLAAVLLVALDTAARAVVIVAEPSFDSAYRLPEGAPMSDLAPLVSHIRDVHASRPRDVVVVFLGASPTYGIGIRGSENTFPASFEAAAADTPLADGRRVRAFNLAANGLLIGDQFVIAKALSDVVDAFVVQLTYQTFDPRRSDSNMRVPELPTILQVGITAEEARALGVGRRTDTPLDRAVDEIVRTRLYMLEHKGSILERFSLADVPRRLYAFLAGGPATENVASGDPQENTTGMPISTAERSGEAWQEDATVPSQESPQEEPPVEEGTTSDDPLQGGPTDEGLLVDDVSPEDEPSPDSGTQPDKPPEDPGDSALGTDPTVPFDELDPALQMVAIARASENSSFTLSADNRELQMLSRLAGYLRSNDKPAVFFFAPMDEDILKAYEVLDERRYQGNVDLLRETLSQSGYGLLDYHSSPFLTSADFVDLTHTTDSGGKRVGRRLWQDARTYLQGAVP